jgi:hypothetical protein
MMSRQDAYWLEPIDGKIVPGARLTPLVGLAIAPLATVLAGGALIVWWLTGVAAPDNAILACGGGVILGLIVAVWAVRELCLPLRLVLGQESLQVLRGRGRVLVQIPYSNIAAVSYAKQPTGRSICIDLLRADDPHTYLDRVPATTQAFELVLSASNLPVYAEKPKVLFAALQDLVSAFRARTGGH